MSQDFRANEETGTRRRANLLRVKYFDVRTLKKLPLYEGVLTKEEIRSLRAVVLQQDKGHMIIAITVSSPQHALKDLEVKFADYQLSFVMISDSGFNDFMLLYDPPVQVTYDDIKIEAKSSHEAIAQISETLNLVKSDDIFNYLVRQAHLLSASDIHLEVEEDHIRIRFRVDGVLHEIAKITPDKYRQLNSTIAIQANISTDSPNAQTGHMNFKVLADDGTQLAEVNMRIETVPTNFGQDAVIRLFNFEKDLLSLDRLGLNEYERSIVDGIIARPTGLVMSVGPTGSGKTTTLYSILNQLNDPERKLITLEDPVEYAMPGVVQMPVDTEHADSFTEKLRAVLRLDPDIIMIGEIRDADTAKTALQASLSGHLVLSTFHASDTTAALARLYEFLGDNPLLTSAIRLVIAQRLVRKLDEQSKERVEPPEHLLKRVRDIIETIPENRRPSLEQATFFKAVKTDAHPFGYSGQTAVVEQLSMTDQLEKLLHQKGSDIDTKLLRQQAINDGMTTLLQNGVVKAMKGETTLEEVFRVIA